MKTGLGLVIYDCGIRRKWMQQQDAKFDVRRMVRTIRRIRPQVRFSLELITRNALKVPCLTEEYRATMPDVPGRDLARTLRFVHEHLSENL